MAAFMISILKYMLVFLPLSHAGGAEPKVEASSAPRRAGGIENQAIKESSGLDQSRRVPGRYWTHNDSGHGPILYALDAEGRSLGTVKVEGAENVDWESLAIDAEGRMWIGDVGNNANTRRDLTVYQVEEPGEALPESLTVARVLRLRYPDQEPFQEAFPPEKMNFDCEAVFLFRERLYLLTKHRSDAHTKLYRVEDMRTEEEQALTLVEIFENIGQVTGADLHSDGRRLAVLTYSGIWIFHREEVGDRFLNGHRQRLDLPRWSMKQSEGIAWVDDETVLISNEQRDLFRVRSGDFSPSE